MSQPATVSVIIPNKNRCDELVQTLASLQAQTYPHWQCIIVDDNSTDAFEDRVRPFMLDSRFVVVKQKPDRGGAPAARNDGAALAKGELLIWLDSDDLLAAGCLENRVRTMRANPALDFAVFPCELFRKVPGDTGLLWNADTGEDDLDRYIRFDVPWQTTSPIWRKSSLYKVGKWDEAAQSAQDWEFHLRAVMAGMAYQRFGPADFYWRMASAERQSIGKNAVMDKGYHRSRIELYRRVLAQVRAAGQLSEQRRKYFAGMYFSAVEMIGRKVNRRDGLRAWKYALQDGVVSRPQYLQGWWLLLNMRWPKRYERLRAALEEKWPMELFLPKSSTFLKTPARRSALGVAEVA